MSHILVITRPAGWTGTPEELEDDEFEFSVECDGVGCDLWQECRRVHVSKYDYRDDDAIEHGEEHRQLEGGWCVRAPGCAYQENGLESDTPWEIAEKHGVGRYPVDLDWYDWGSAILIFAGDPS